METFGFNLPFLENVLQGYFEKLVKAAFGRRGPKGPY
jgi:hypothetical protein